MTTITDDDTRDLEPDFLDFAGAGALCAAGRVDPAQGAAVDAARRVVREAVARDRADTTGGRGRRRRRFAVSAVAVAAVAAGVFVLPVTGTDGAPPAAGANAATFLRDVAVTAAQKPASHARYWKVRARYTMSTRPGQEQTNWYSRTSVTLLNPGGRESSVCHGDFCTFRSAGQTTWSVGRERVTWDELAELPTDPQALRTRLLSGSTDGDRALYNGIVSLLTTAPSGPHLRAALFEILAGMDGVRLLGPVKDSEGRRGTAVEWQGPSMHHVLIVDPAGSTVLEHREKGHGALRDARGTTTFLSTGPARQLG
ncbi:CU044_5270 family protein [Streptomyces lushanensis]|uniref:CU044_5270 family protein n=1 Tax=Streptomyces lushanensis TaxID=1434255 RepID=UPI0008335522|nr:CU044_5270 family protein [Streptomyces lushanensis]